MKATDSRLHLVADLPRPIAFVLAGGASFGAVQVGHLRALARTDITPDLVVGTSVGALNGTAVALDPDTAADRLASVWASLRREDIFGSPLTSAYRLAARQSSLADHSALRSLVERMLPVRHFSDLQLPLTAVATDFDSGDLVDLHKGDLVTAILASASIPGIFPFVERGGNRLVDGGLVANLPVTVAAEASAKTIVILDCGLSVMPYADASIMGAIFRSFGIMATRQTRRDLASVTDRHVLYLPGPWPVTRRPDDFSNSSPISDATYSITREWLKALRIDGPGIYGSSPFDMTRESNTRTGIAQFAD